MILYLYHFNEIFTLEQATKTSQGSRGVAILFL